MKGLLRLILKSFSPFNKKNTINFQFFYFYEHPLPLITISLPPSVIFQSLLNLVHGFLERKSLHGLWRSERIIGNKTSGGIRFSQDITDER